MHAFLSDFFRRCMKKNILRACLHGGGVPQVGEGKNKPPSHAILQPRHPGVHFLKIIERSLSM